MALPRSLGTAAAFCACVLAVSCHLVSGVEDYYLLGEGDGGSSASSAGAGGSSSTSASSGTAAGGSTSSGTGGTGTGGTTTGCNPESCEGPNNDCAKTGCMNEECKTLFEATETSCDDDGGHYCDGKGYCLECLGDQHCNGGTCQDGKCYTASCSDSVQNGGEVDVDCGGPCGPCDNGKKCNTPLDCKSQICQGGFCQPCANQTDCPSGMYCDAGGSKLCLNKKNLGDGCGNGYECKSEQCHGLFHYCCSMTC